MKSIHDIRVFNFAIIDIIGTFIIAYILYHYQHKFYKFNSDISFPVIFGILILAAIFIHYLLGIPTTLNNILHLSGPSQRSTNNNIFSIY